jgi:hypothetical protein
MSSVMLLCIEMLAISYVDLYLFGRPFPVCGNKLSWARHAHLVHSSPPRLLPCVSGIRFRTEYWPLRHSGLNSSLVLTQPRSPFHRLSSRGRPPLHVGSTICGWIVAERPEYSSKVPFWEFNLSNFGPRQPFIAQASYFSAVGGGHLETALFAGGVLGEAERVSYPRHAPSWIL